MSSVLKYMEGVNSVTSNVVEDVVSSIERQSGITISPEDEDKIWDVIQDVLSKYSETGDYRGYN